MTGHERRLVAEGFATVRQAAEYLGCSKSRVYELVNGRVLTHAVNGGRIAIPWATLKAYAAERLVQGSVA